MINQHDIVTDPHHGNFHPLKRIYWSAIFVGAIIGVGLTFLFNLFGLSIGLTAYTLNDQGSIVLLVGGLLGISISTIVSMFLAGYATGYLSRFWCPKRNLGILYGFTTWSIALLLCSIIASQMTTYVTSYANAMSHSKLIISNDNTQESTTLTVNTATPDKHQPFFKATMKSSSLTGLSFSVFTLFFIGAVSSCIGACWGMSCKRED